MGTHNAVTAELQGRGHMERSSKYTRRFAGYWICPAGAVFRYWDGQDLREFRGGKDAL